MSTRSKAPPLLNALDRAHAEALNLSKDLRGIEALDAKKLVGELVEVREVSTGPTSSLRVALVSEGTAGPRLILAQGRGRGATFYRPAGGGSPIVIPIGAVAELRQAIEELVDPEPPAAT